MVSVPRVGVGDKTTYLIDNNSTRLWKRGRGQDVEPIVTYVELYPNQIKRFNNKDNGLGIGQITTSEPGENRSTTIKIARSEMYPEVNDSLLQYSSCAPAQENFAFLAP